MRAARPTLVKDDAGCGRRLRVLVSAYACNPYRGSEDGVGWGWIRAIASRHEVHVITADFQREHVERWQREHPADEAGVRFHYVPPRWFHHRPTRGWRFVETSLLKPLMNLAYAQWLRDAARLAADLDETEDFDLVHLVTYVGYRFPGRYWRLGKPFVWGPIGGLENTRWRFLPSLGAGGCVYYAARNVVNSLQKRLLPSPKRAFRHARGGVIAATSGNAREIERFFGVKSEVIAEVGLPGAVAEQPAVRRPAEPLRIAWSGEHLPGKALPFLLEALGRLDAATDWRLTVLGEGTCTGKWKALAERLAISDRIEFTGWIERAAALDQLRAAHVFVITSLKDLTSTVLLEALGQGLPVLCPDHCGFADVIDETCGIKIGLESPEHLRAGLTQAIRDVERDESLRLRMAEGALARARAFTWEEKAAQIEDVYGRVLPVRSAEGLEQDAEHRPVPALGIS